MFIVARTFSEMWEKRHIGQGEKWRNEMSFAFYALLPDRMLTVNDVN